jgi:hypothetical protein
MMDVVLLAGMVAAMIAGPPTLILGLAIREQRLRTAPAG